MKQVTQDSKTGELKIIDAPVPLIKKGGVLVRNHFSLISAGTERAIIELSKKSPTGRAKENSGRLKQLIQSVRTRGLKETYGLVRDKLNELSTPAVLGYSSSGTVIEVGKDVSEFQVGDRVSCAGTGYANHAEIVSVPKNFCVKIPQGVAFEEAPYASVGAVALHGIRLADVHLGEAVAVIGSGLIGLLTIELLKASGCTVIAIDIDPFAVRNARTCGADYAINSTLENTRSAIQSVTQSYGVDAAIITAASHTNEPVELAGEISRKKGRVIAVGNVGTNIPRNVYYYKELDFKISCSYGPGRHDPDYEENGIDYPFGYVRWTEKRNMEVFLRLVGDKKIDVRKVSTHKFKMENVKEAYGFITHKGKRESIGILLEYDSQTESAQNKC